MVAVEGSAALDGYLHAVKATLAFPDTGDIRADLIDQLRHFAHLTTATPAGKILTELVGQSQTDDELAVAYRARYSAERRQLAVERMRRAQDAGQIRPDVDLQVLVHQLWGAVYHRLLNSDEPITDEFITALVTNLLDGIVPH